MKNTIRHIIPAVSAAFIMAFSVNAQDVKPITHQDFNTSINKIIDSNKIRHNVFKDAEIVNAMMEYYKTEGLSEDQKSNVLKRASGFAIRVNDDGKSYNNIINQMAAIQDDRRRNDAFNHVINEFTHVYAGKTQYIAAEKLVAENRGLGTNDPRRQIQVYSRLASRALPVMNDKARFDKYLDSLTKVANPETDEKKVEAFNKYKQEQIVPVISSLAGYDPVAALALFGKLEKDFADSPRISVYREFAINAMKAKDRKSYDAAIAKILALPVGQDRANAVRAIAPQLASASGEGRSSSETKTMAETLVENELEAGKNVYPPRTIFDLLWTLRGLENVSSFNYGFNNPGSYDRYKATTLKMLEVIKNPELKPDGQIANFYNQTARAAFDFGDFAFAKQMIEKALEIQPNNVDYKLLAAEIIFKNNRPDALKMLESIVADEKANNDRKALARAIIFFAANKNQATFDKEFEDMKYTSGAKMAAMRKAGEFFFKAGDYAKAREINDWIMKNMFLPVEQKKYTVKYIPDCPKSADGFVRTKHYDDWAAMETRFVPYGDGYDQDHGTDEKRLLKDAPAQTVDPKFKTGVLLAYDDEGIHIFVRMLDPEIEEVKLGKRNAGSLECLLKPGNDFAYHSWYFEGLPDTDEGHIVNWASPSREYKLTYDFFKKDAVTTKDGVVAHTYIPWIMFHNKLPVNGNKWIYGLQAWGRQAQSLSGLVHEHARALELEFKFTPEQLKKLKRNVAITAFNKYNNIRRNPGLFIQTWNDQLLGDPTFYKAELEEFIAELDEAGQKLMAPAPDSQIDAIYDKYVPLWAEIEYVIADKRADYLKRKFLED